MGLHVREAVGGVKIPAFLDSELPVWEDMTYDQQRVFLGLPDVRGYVARESFRRMGNHMRDVVAPAFVDMGRAFAQGLDAIRAAYEPELIQRDYGLAGEK